jgi:hypothetical protein
MESFISRPLKIIRRSPSPPRFRERIRPLEKRRFPSSLRLYERIERGKFEREEQMLVVGLDAGQVYGATGPSGDEYEQGFRRGKTKCK